MATTSANPQEVIEYLFRPILDAKSLTDALGSTSKKLDELNSSIETSLARVVKMEAYGIDRYSKKNQELYQNTLNRIRAEERELAILANSYNTMARQLAQYNVEQKANNTYGIQSSNARANAISKEIDLTRQLGIARAQVAATNAVKDPYGIQSSNARAGTTTERFTTGSLGGADVIKGQKDIQSALKDTSKATQVVRKDFMDALNSGMTFGHRFVTTMQYAIAGSTFYAMIAAAGAFTTAIIEADKYNQMFQGVLEMTAKQADGLQQSIYNVGKEIGGTTKGISEAALMLGRAGLANEQLAEGLRVAAMAANVSGDAIENITEMLASWQTVYPEESITHLGDMMAKIANESLLSIDGLKTATSYITASGAAAGVTATQLIELAGAWKQTGKADSIVGTEIRRLFSQIEGGSDDVKKAYWSMGIDVDKVNKGLKSGVKEVQEATFRAFMESLGNYETLPKKQKASVDKLIANLQVLDKQTVQSSIVAGRSFKDMEKAGNNASGSLEKASDKIALSYEKMFERILVVASEGANKFEAGFSKALSGGASLGSFNKNLENISISTNIVYSALGSLTGEVLAPFGTALSGLVQTLGLLIKGFDSMYSSLEDIHSGLGAATIAMVAFGAIVIKNPFIAVAAGAIELLMTLKEIVDLKDQIAGSNLKGATATASISDIQSVSRYSSSSDKLKEIDRITKELETRLNKYTSISELSLSRANSETKLKIDNSIKMLTGRLEAIKKLKADIISASVKKPEAAIADINAQGDFVGKDTNKGKAARDRNAQQLLDSYKEIIKASEQEWFLTAGINDELSKKKYNLEVTLPALKSISELTVDQERRAGEVAKVEQEIFKTKIEILAIEHNMKQLGVSRIQELSDQEELAKSLSEEQKLRVNYIVKEAQLQRELGDNIVNNKYTQEDALKIYNKQLEILKAQTTEQIRLIEVTNSYNLSNYEKAQSRVSEDLKAQTDYITYRNKLLREAEDISDAFYQKVESGKEITELDVKQYEDRLKLIERSSYSTYVGMQIQQEMQSVLNSGLSDFFNIQSEGWMNFEKLGMSVLTSLMQKMLQMQLIEPLAAAGASGISGLFSGFFSAQGNVVGPNGKIPMYAKGGTFTNSIVSKPTMFAHGSGFGIMGEAGPESIMPLKRSKSGDLGVVAIGANNQPQQVTVQIRNESGESLAVTKSEARTDMSGMVIDIIIDAVARNKKGMRDVIRGGR